MLYVLKSDQDQLEHTLDGFLCAARISCFYSLPSVFDSLLVTLCQFSSLMQIDRSHFSSASAVNTVLRSFGLSHKAQMAAVTLFGIRRTLGGNIIGAWKEIGDAFYNTILYLPTELSSLHFTHSMLYHVIASNGGSP